MIPDDPEVNVIKQRDPRGQRRCLAYARVPLTTSSRTEYSHHYGVANFRKVGAVLINVINRAYAKKVLVQLPGQSASVALPQAQGRNVPGAVGRAHHASSTVASACSSRGDTLTVPPACWHCFRTDTGCVFEEISTTAIRTIRSIGIRRSMR